MSSLKLANYSIEIGDAQSTLAKLNSWLRARNWSRVFVLVDENTARDCWPLVQQALWPKEHVLIQIEAGEQHKHIDTCKHIWKQMVAGGADRHSLMVNLGGGVIGDMGGFAASTFMRGISFLNIPTTLLSQVDASVGGKLGVDFEGLKNMVGMFRDPLAVLLCPDFFDTLPPEELRSGYAEVLKHAIIRDAAEFEYLEGQNPLQIPDWSEIVSHSVNIKKEVVEQDPFEGDLRKILNFGHTIGHAVETESFQYEKPLLHGEAIAIGMICESWLSYKLGMLSEEVLHGICAAVMAAFPFQSIKDFDRDRIMEHMLHDKKNVSGTIRLSLLPAIGDCTPDCEADTRLILESLDFHETIYGTHSA